MTVKPGITLRLQFLVRVVRKECRHLATTDQRLFASAFTLAQARRLETDPDLAERVEAFVGRFGRLQDTVGDKLLPSLLTALGEKSSATIDNLDRAKRLGLLVSADEWMIMRKLDNLVRIGKLKREPQRLLRRLRRTWMCECRERRMRKSGRLLHRYAARSVGSYSRF